MYRRKPSVAIGIAVFGLVAVTLCGCGPRFGDIFGRKWEVRGTVSLDGQGEGTLYIRAVDAFRGRAVASKVVPSPSFPLSYSLEVEAEKCVIVAYLDVGDDSPNWSLGEGDILGAYSKPLSKGSPERTQANFTLDLPLWNFDFEINDPEGDFAQPGGGAPPQGVYHYPPSDVVRIAMKAGRENLYVLCQVAGQIPTAKVEAEDGNMVLSVGVWMGLDLDNDPQTGCLSDGGAEALICYQADLEHGDDSAYFFAGPTGIEEPEEQRYERHSEAAFIYGGRGTDLLLVAYPLDEIGLQKGTTISVSGAVEAESDKWHHFSFDEIERTTWAVPQGG